MFVYKIELVFKTNLPPDKMGVKELLMEQWEQTPAFSEGDTISIIKVTEIQTNKET